ncbi:hypothetical protein [Methylobacter sp. YRD-M1]|uniref:hypothetical protein n=1 Tax=Methylobacter sp. YRD-M1 TaxID=2911520 RepID=UPI00227A2CE1|nr:hypothetical protein [Methylobacter sp. YRD-M1]WAK04454.1 hypothetical protein LZ558_20945 [Methylobacter sp. YRD-M1]
MIDWYIKSRTLLRELQKKALDALRHCEDGEESVAKTIAGYMKADFQSLRQHWDTMFPEETFGYLGRHIGFAMRQDFNDIIKFDLPEVEDKLDRRLKEFKKSLPNSKQVPYVSEDRIQELSEVSSTKYDVSKLLRMLRELNIAHNNDCHFTIGVLLRAIIDHVPPIFSCSNFSEIANNYQGTKSFKKSMKHLNESLRNLADSYLHVQIRNKESLPNINQVDFQADLDCLLAEIARILD